MRDLETVMGDYEEELAKRLKAEAEVAKLREVNAELLAAIKAARHRLSTEWQGDPIKVWKQIEAAIAKAGGLFEERK
jgi:hypothetical protein